MKVLHIISGDLWAGAEVQAFTLLTALQKQSGMQVAASLMNEGELAKRLRAHHIPVTVFPENKLNSIQIFFGLRKLISDWQPDIVHTHRIKENILGSIANKLPRNVPSVRTVHRANEHNAKGILKVHKHLLRRLDLWCGAHLQQNIIAVSNDLADKLATEFPREKLIVIENGVDIDAVRAQIYPVDFRSREPQATHIGIVGPLVPVKRVDLFLETAKLLTAQDHTRDWRFHVFGDGPLTEQLIEQAKTLGIDEATTFHGHRSDIIACIAALDALMMCSDHEGLPMTLLESLAAGTPVIAHAVGGIAKALANGSRGFAVQRHDALGYAAAVIELLKQNDVSQRDKQQIAEKYSSGRCIETGFSTDIQLRNLTNLVKRLSN